MCGLVWLLIDVTPVLSGMERIFPLTSDKNAKYI
jgi:hypothetical protein